MDWLKTVITLIVAAAFIGVIIGITTPMYNLGTYSTTNLACTQNQWCQLPYPNIINSSKSLGNYSNENTLTEGTDYKIDLTLGRLNVTNTVKWPALNVSYQYYPGQYDTGSNGSTTRSIAAIVPAAFFIVVLVGLFTAALYLWGKRE